jgi:hypothetical protein
LWPEKPCFHARGQIDAKIGVSAVGWFGYRGEWRDVARIVARQTVTNRKICLRPGKRMPNWIIERVLHVRGLPDRTIDIRAVDMMT